MIVHALNDACPDRVIGRDHPAYDDVRLLFNGMHDLRPRLICLPRYVAELRAVIRATRDAGLPTAVRGGGHNVAGSAAVEDGLVIDLRLMSAVSVDPVARTAVAGGGATWSQFDLATTAYGLATTGGTFDTTGVGGLALGGGLGHLMGKHGLTCDNVLSYELVTAAGEVLVVDAERDPDLDWALRGAGHGLGVVSAFHFRVHPVGLLWGGCVAYPRAELGAAVRLFRDLMLGAPDELNCTLLLKRYGPTQVPAAVILVAYSGGDEEYRAALEKRLGEPEVLDWQLTFRSYLSAQAALGRLAFGLRHHWSGRFVDALPDSLADALAERFEAARYRDGILVEPLHGAVRRVDAESTAVPFRGAAFNVTGTAIWTDPAADEQQVTWARSVAAAAEPHSRWGDGYVNYASTGDWAGKTTASERLTSVKRRLDPDGFFRGRVHPVSESLPTSSAPGGRGPAGADL
ncbi:FAD-binding oxidoreductase [Nonomuraea sp. NPDC049480]|uniref:FAD-binding oxidoreductase n=1 Tax=Nonomuraea sp. NPDC049480 TaxID=3364353 RepID=UPI0037B9833A